MLFTLTLLTIFVGAASVVASVNLHLVPILLHIAVERGIRTIEDSMVRAQWNSLPAQNSAVNIYLSKYPLIHSRRSHSC